MWLNSMEDDEGKSVSEELRYLEDPRNVGLEDRYESAADLGVELFKLAATVPPPPWLMRLKLKAYI